MMLRVRAAFSALLLTLSCSVHAFAQPPTQPSAAIEYPKWDAGGSWGVVFSNHRDLKAFDDNDPGASAFNVDLGRYFTTHLKADVGVMWNQSHYADGRLIPIAGLPPEYTYLGWATVTIRPTSLSAALTYQFRENELLHPYLSGGVRTIRQAIHTERFASAPTIRGVRYTIPAVDERSTSVIARPFVAVGCKSYFNRWVYMRPELAVAVGPDIYSHATLRIGAGVDF